MILYCPHCGKDAKPLYAGMGGYNCGCCGKKLNVCRDEQEEGLDAGIREDD